MQKLIDCKLQYINIFQNLTYKKLLFINLLLHIQLKNISKLRKRCVNFQQISNLNLILIHFLIIIIYPFLKLIILRVNYCIQSSIIIQKDLIFLFLDPLLDLFLKLLIIIQVIKANKDMITVQVDNQVANYFVSLNFVQKEFVFTFEKQLM